MVRVPWYHGTGIACTAYSTNVPYREQRVQLTDRPAIRTVVPHNVDDLVSLNRTFPPFRERVVRRRHGVRRRGYDLRK